VSAQYKGDVKVAMAAVAKKRCRNYVLARAIDKSYARAGLAIAT
jgi:hypothetical protein